MNEIVREWIEKADGDYVTANREFMAEDRPNYDAVCFHSQQCIEKMMKAVLINKNEVPPRTHDLVYISQIIKTGYDNWDWLQEELRYLSHSSVAFRYPGESAELDEAKVSIDICTRLRDRLLNLL